MKSLSETWFAEGYIDFEQKKYTLLAYLQAIHAQFREQKLYPQLADIIFHYNNLIAFRNNKQHLQQQFPRRLSGIQLQRLTLLYEQLIEDNELMQELEDIIHFAEKNMKSTIDEGAALYDQVEQHIQIFPIGLIPLQKEEGYFFLLNGSRQSTRVYQYRLSIFEKQQEKYRSIQTTYIDQWPYNLVNTCQHIKTELIRRKKDLPNPAVYAAETHWKFPLDETLLPVAKRCLVRHITTSA